MKALWGKLTDKNNPYLEQNANSSVLMQFPEGCYVMDPHKPYVELIAGVHNIFKLLHVEYVHRCNYNELPTAQTTPYYIYRTPLISKRLLIIY